MIGGNTLRKRLRGIALVETTIMAPVLLLLVLAIAEITNAFVDHNTLTKTVRNGARYLAANALLGTTGTVPLAIDGTLIGQTKNIVVYGNTAGGGNPILAGLGTGNVDVIRLDSEKVQITASLPYAGILGDTLPVFGFGSDINLGLTLQASVSMRAL